MPFCTYVCSGVLEAGNCDSREPVVLRTICNFFSFQTFNHFEHFYQYNKNQVEFEGIAKELSMFRNY